tara:strand:+ start:8191 stop:8319 length:129 start_codon:yes stop_codon:yes gene_type:complete
MKNPEWQDIIYYTQFSFQNGFSKPKSEPKSEDRKIYGSFKDF